MANVKSDLIEGEYKAECECCSKVVDVDDERWEKMAESQICPDCEK